MSLSLASKWAPTLGSKTDRESELALSLALSLFRVPESDLLEMQRVLQSGEGQDDEAEQEALVGFATLGEAHGAGVDEGEGVGPSAAGPRVRLSVARA